MKLEATENGFLLTAESDFDVIALNVWRGRKPTVMMETYKRDAERFGDKAKASGFLRVDFEDSIIKR